MRVTGKALLVSTAVLAMTAAAPALAQVAAPNAGAGDNSSGNIAQEAPLDTGAGTKPGTGEDIIVTAQKRAQTLIDVPQSVSVISGAVLETQQATNFEDYLKLVPGLQLEQATPGQGRLIIRGIDAGGAAAAVAVYEDETPFGSSSGLANGAVLAGDFDTFDVARIEVLRGPQGTLYGASSLGGVLKFVTNAPETDRFIGRARGGVETTQGGDLSYFGNAVINVPLGDTLAIRASGTYRNNGGFVDSIGTGGSRVRNNINGSRVYGGRASLLFKPSDRVSLRLSALLQNIDTDAPTLVESNPTTLATLYGRPTQSIFVSPFRNVDYRVYNGTANIDLGFANLTSSTSYSTLKQAVRQDVTFQLSGLIAGAFKTPNELYLGQNLTTKKFTQELRLSSEKNRYFDWLIGGYYTRETALIFQQYVPVTPGTLTQITTLPVLAQVNLSSRYKEYAGFGNATIHLGEHFDVDFGGRYSHNDQTATQSLNGALVGGASSYTQPSSENVFTYSAAPKLKFSRNASLYGRVAKGFRPGGPNALAPGAPAAARSYLSDSTINYEVGFKAQTADRTFSIDLAAFHIDWSRIQLLTTLATAAGPFSYNGNGGKAKVDGVEFTGTVRPTEGLDLSVNGAITNARLTQDSPAAGGFAGDKLPFSPRYSIGVNGDYRWAMAGPVKPYIGASLRSLSKQAGPLGLLAGKRPIIPSYEVVDLRAGLDLGRFSVEAYARNITNADGKTSVGTLGVYPAGAVGTGVIRPRTVGLSVSAGF